RRCDAHARRAPQAGTRAMKRSNRVLLIVGGVIAVLFVASVGAGLFVLDGMRHYSPLGFSEWNGHLIDHVGKYGLKSGERIEVTIEHDNTVGFELFSDDGRKIAKNDQHPSSTQKWALCLDDQKWL